VEAEVDPVEVPLGLAVSNPVLAERLAKRQRHLGQCRGHAPSASDGTLSAARSNAQRMLSCTIDAQIGFRQPDLRVVDRGDIRLAVAGCVTDELSKRSGGYRTPFTFMGSV
jgi:hypothetical protein